MGPERANQDRTPSLEDIQAMRQNILDYRFKLPLRSMEEIDQAIAGVRKLSGGIVKIPHFKTPQALVEYINYWEGEKIKGVNFLKFSVDNQARAMLIWSVIDKLREIAVTWDEGILNLPTREDDGLLDSMQEADKITSGLRNHTFGTLEGLNSLQAEMEKLENLAGRALKPRLTEIAGYRGKSRLASMLALVKRLLSQPLYSSTDSPAKRRVLMTDSLIIQQFQKRLVDLAKLYEKETGVKVYIPESQSERDRRDIPVGFRLEIDALLDKTPIKKRVKTALDLDTAINSLVYGMYLHGQSGERTERYQDIQKAYDRLIEIRERVFGKPISSADDSAGYHRDEPKGTDDDDDDDTMIGGRES